jgi:HEAT repeat protein
VTSDVTSSVALIAAAVAVALTLVLLAYSLGLRITHILHDRELRRLRAQCWPVFVEATEQHVSDQESNLIAIRRFSRVKLLREWCRFRSLVRGDKDYAFEELADDLALLPLARRLLRRKSTGKRLLAIQALGFLRDRESLPTIERLLQHPGVAISITAATALVHIDSKRAIPMIIPMIAERRSWPRTQVGRILNVAGPALVTGPLCDAIETSGPEEAAYLLQFHESAALVDMDSTIAKLLSSRSDPRLLAAGLKSVRGHLSDVLIKRLAEHEVWYVRMQAARLLGRLGRREDYQILEPLLSDREWWVRYRAAQAITGLPFLGPNALRKLCDRQKDRFARDMLRQALAEARLI